jgi:hypothetical protein
MCARFSFLLADSFTVAMDGGNGSGCNSPGRCIVTPGSFSTPMSPVDVGSVQGNAVTPVTQSALGPLMHTSVITPQVTISPLAIETPPAVLHTHVSTCSFAVVLFMISYQEPSM